LQTFLRKKDLVSLSRLRRLVKSGISPAESAQAFARELRDLVGKAVDEDAVRRESEIFKALSDPTRLKIMRLLGAREMCVCEIMVALETTQPTASHHLNILERAGLVKDRREGKWIFYRLASPRLLALIPRIRSAAG